MSKNKDGLNVYYVKDKETGNIIRCNVRGGKAEQERVNQKLIKDRKQHLIRFEIVEKPKEVEESPVKKPGRPAQKK